MNTSDNIKKTLKSGNQTLHLYWLNRYAEDKLTEVEKFAFEDFINESDDFVLKTAFEGLKENNNASDTENIRLKIKNTKETQTQDYFKFLKIAAIFIMILSLTLAYVFINDNYFNEEVLVDSFEKSKTESKTEVAQVEPSNIKSEEVIKQIKEDENKDPILEKPNLNMIPKPSVQTEKDIAVATSQPTVTEIKKEVEAYSGVTKSENINDQPQVDAITESAVKNSEIEDKTRSKQMVSRNESIVNDEVGFQKAHYPGGVVEMNKFIKNEKKKSLNTDIDTGNVVVKLKLTIKPNGNIKNIKVVQSLSKEYDNEAIKIVKKMPKWIPTNRNGENVEDEVNVDVNFD